LYAVRCIEDRLSTTLFERNGTTMRPTAAAHRLYPCAIRLLEMWDELIAELRPPPDSAPATADPAPGDTPAESASLPASALPAPAAPCQPLPPVPPPLQAASNPNPNPKPGSGPNPNLAPKPPRAQNRARQPPQPPTRRCSRLLPATLPNQPPRRVDRCGGPSRSAGHGANLRQISTAS
jgi:hypothetical protein